METAMFVHPTPFHSMKGPRARKVNRAMFPSSVHWKRLVRPRHTLLFPEGARAQERLMVSDGSPFRGQGCALGLTSNGDPAHTFPA